MDEDNSFQDQFSLFKDIIDSNVKIHNDYITHLLNRIKILNEKIVNLEKKIFFLNNKISNVSFILKNIKENDLVKELIKKKNI